MQGIVQNVVTRWAGGYPIFDAMAGQDKIVLDDAADFDETGGRLLVRGAELPYTSADIEENVLTLAAPLGVTLTDEDFIEAHPRVEETVAVVALDDDIVEAAVPHALKAFLPVGPREGDVRGEAVYVDLNGGRPRVTDVVGSRPALDADFVNGAERLVLESGQRLGEALAAAAARSWAAAGRLDAAEGLLDDAFDQIGAIATTQADGVAKSVWSADPPGTTRLPQNSTWYQHDAAGNIIAVFNQTAASEGTTHGNTWVASTIRSEVIHGLDLGKLTVAGDATMQQAVINSLVAQIAAFVKADIGNLTVTGTSTLNDVVAERIGANVAEFISIVAQQITGGQIVASIGIGTNGAIVAGDPNGAAVEMTKDGITVYEARQEEDGGPVTRSPSTVLGGAGADRLELLDANGDIISGFSSKGEVKAQSGSFLGDVTLGGTPLLGQKLDPASDPGWLDEMQQSIVFRRMFTANPPARPNGEEWGYARIKVDVKAGRLYRLGCDARVRSILAGSVVDFRFRWNSSGGNAALSSPWLVFHRSHPLQGDGTDDVNVSSLVEFEETGTLGLLFTYQGQGGATPVVTEADIWLEDMGAVSEPDGALAFLAPSGTTGGQTQQPTKKTYTSVWKANLSQSYSSNGAKRSSGGDLVQGDAGQGRQRAATVFMSTAESGEKGKTISEALSGGATVKKVEVYLYFNHWYNSTGGRAVLGSLGRASIPDTLPDSALNPSVTGPVMSAGTGRWITVPNSWFGPTGNRGITLGTMSTSREYYGRADSHAKSHPPKVRITYVR